VHFTCNEYGKTHQGTLHVRTQWAEYSFALVGRLPVYEPPDPLNTMHKVDDRLSPDLVRLMVTNREVVRRRKYLLDNISKTKTGTHW
jgi:hypothetical protein